MKKGYLLISFALAFGLSSCGQQIMAQNSEPYYSSSIFTITDDVAMIKNDTSMAIPSMPSGIIGQGYSKDDLLSNPAPFYPVELRRNGIQGKVIIAVFIDDSGTVRKAKIISSPHTGFNKSALYTAMNWRFNPSRKALNNIWLTIPFIFYLK